MKWAFEQLAIGLLATEHVWMKALERGLKCSRNGFWSLISNPCYIGKITIPKFKDEEAYLVDGQHEALISESTFHRVQEVLDSRKRSYQKKGIKAVSPRSLALRGFLLCPKCGRILSGSASRGRHLSYYPYYHCKSTCGVRFKADLVNRLFERHFKQFVPKPGMAELFTEIVSDAYTKGGGRWQRDQSRIMEIIADQNKRLTKSMELLLDEVITASEYKQIKEECRNTVAKCEVELKKLNEQDEEKLDIPGLAALAVENLKKLSDFYANADSDIKRAIIGSIYQDKWVFDGETHRTPEANEAALLIYHINKRLRHKKTGVKISENFHSGEVPIKKLT